MTTSFSFSQDPDRFNYLFEVAMGQILVHDPNEAGLSAEDIDEISQLRELIRSIEQGWQASEQLQASVRSLFLEKLAAKNPDHPWVRDYVVSTLGELVRIAQDDLPVLSDESYARIARDATPLTTLMNGEQRTAALGQALRRAAVPLSLVGDFLVWINSAIGDIVSSKDSNKQVLIYTRPQGQPREPK